MHMTRRLMALHAVPALLLGTAGAAARPAQAAVDPGRAAAFIRTTGDELVAAINDPRLGLDARRRRVADILRQAVDIEGAGRFVLGRHWRQASPSERQEYLRLFEEVIIRNLAARFGEYRGVRFAVAGTERRADGDALVTTTVERPGTAAFALGWRVREVAGRPRIVDMIAEGVSLRLTKRSEYSSVVHRGGGIAALLAAMRDQIRQLAMRESP